MRIDFHSRQTLCISSEFGPLSAYLLLIEDEDSSLLLGHNSVREIKTFQVQLEC